MKKHTTVCDIDCLLLHLAKRIGKLDLNLYKALAGEI